MTLTDTDRETWRRDAQATQCCSDPGCSGAMCEQAQRILALDAALTAKDEALVDWRERVRQLESDRDSARDEREAAEAQVARLTEMTRPLAVYRCRVCAARWLLWGGDIAGLQAGTWNLLDQWQYPGSCCDNAPMDAQMEFVRDIVARAALAPGQLEMENRS